MTKISNLIFIVVLSANLFGQNGNELAIPVYECAGAVNIFENGEYHLQFTGEKSSSLNSYPSLKESISNNFLWISFIAGAEGELTFEAKNEHGPLQMVVFIEANNDICGELSTGTAEIKRVSYNKELQTVGLQYAIKNGVLYPLKLNVGDKVQVLLATSPETKETISLNWNFKESDPPVIIGSKIVDHRTDEFSPALIIKVQDKETKEPIIANVTLSGLKELDALYVGSELLFSLVRNCQAIIKCDAQGYFFVDKDTTLKSTEDYEIVIEMERIAKGKSMQIEDIEFVPGTSEITTSSLPKLRRLKDFLLLNAELEIEIQGHVFALGENSFAGQKISEARAKRVMNYLVDNGIDRNRLSAVGYGNTKPIFPEPKFSYEEQANRRVEIVVK